MTTKVENSSLLSGDLASSGGRGFLSTLVKKTATEKKVAPRGQSKPSGSDSQSSSTEPRYQNYSEIIQNMSQKAPMSIKDMKLLQENIKKLDQEAHVEICRMLVENQKPGTNPDYTVNNYGTYFDIVDLPTDLLWRIHYYVNLSLEDMARQKIKEEALQQFERDQAENPQYQKMKHQQSQTRSQNIFHQALPTYSIDNLPSYEDLREDALRNLKQSQGSIMNSNLEGNEPQLNNGEITELTENQNEIDENELSEEFDNPDSVPIGDFADDNTEMGDEPSEIDDFD